MTFGLLVFEIWRANTAERALRASEARRLLSWVEPIRYEFSTQGIVREAERGWQMVVFNGADDVVSDWVATTFDKDGKVLAASGSELHGVLAPHKARSFDLPPAAGMSENGLPRHYPLEATCTLRFIDREGRSWSRRAGQEPTQESPSLGTLPLGPGAPVAKPSQPYERHAQGTIARRIRD